MDRPGDATESALRTVWVARHGERRDYSDPAWARTAPRPLDPPLSRTGVEQSVALGGRLAGQRVAHLFASPFLRALETAHRVAEVLDLPVKVEPGLAEWLSPAWFAQPPELLACDERARRFPRIDGAYRARGEARYGESGEEARDRAGRTARRLAEDFPGHLLLVGHGASVLGAVAGLLRIAPDAVRPALGDMPYGCVVRLTHHGNAHWVIDDVDVVRADPPRHVRILA